MPPQRTFPSVKPLKTERTHEENQERAYIAASRRSDRSLEARVESARRASEIHKRRTGRSLRVTEQDVINEEMYEEEDDDIPRQYRSLTAHLQTGSAELNRRLQSYLVNHMAVRTALNDAIHNSFSQHYPNAPTFAHNTSMMQSPLAATQPMPSTEPMRSPVVVSPHTPHIYRSAPYPTHGRPGYRGFTPQQQQQQQQQQQHPYSQQSPSSMRARQSSTQSPALQSTPTTPATEFPLEHRRMSMPTAKSERPEFQITTKPSSPLSEGGTPTDPLAKTISSQPAPVRAKTQATIDPSIQPPIQLTEDQEQNPLPMNVQDFPLASDNLFGPFSMALPMESQQMVNAAALPQNDFGAALMAGSERWMYDSSELGASNPGEMLKPDSNFYPNPTGMNSTLLSEYASADAVPISGDKLDPATIGAVQGVDFGQFLDFGGSNSSNAPSGAGTPASDPQAWKDLIESNWIDDSGGA